MQSSRHSCVLRTAYSGNRGKQIVAQAIEFLFFIKSSEFRKFHPTFITPTPVEFFEHAKYTHDTYPRVRRYQTRTVSAITKHPHTLLDHFLSFILPGLPNKLLRHYAIVVYALASFFMFREVVDVRDDASAAATAFVASFHTPVTWFVHAITPSVSKSMPERFFTYVEHAIAPKLHASSFTTHNSEMFETIGRDVVHKVAHIMSDDVIRHMYFVIPVSYTLASHGFEHLNQICAKSIEKYKDRFVV
jgi:hypothetical protein